MKSAPTKKTLSNSKPSTKVAHSKRSHPKPYQSKKPRNESLLAKFGASMRKPPYSFAKTEKPNYEFRHSESPDIKRVRPKAFGPKLDKKPGEFQLNNLHPIKTTLHENTKFRPIPTSVRQLLDAKPISESRKPPQPVVPKPEPVIENIELTPPSPPATEGNGDQVKKFTEVIHGIPDWAIIKGDGEVVGHKIREQLTVAKDHASFDAVPLKFTPDVNPSLDMEELGQPSVEVFEKSDLEVYCDDSKDIRDLLDDLGIESNNIGLYEEALTHNSYSNESASSSNYQRLEFLGDAIINKVVTVFLYKSSKNDEGHMTKDRISIIQAKTLARASSDLKLGEYLRLGHGLRHKPVSEKILEDIFESFIGATYLDQGEHKIKELLKDTILKYYINDDLQNTIDYKTQFQEAMQEHSKQSSIVYKRINTADRGVFEVELLCNGIIYGRGRGQKLHDAEVAAAKKACGKISKLENEA